MGASEDACKAGGFERIAIVGVGLIGGSLGLAVRQAAPSSRLVGISRDETIAKALELGVVDEGYPYEELDRGIAKADLILLCTPIRRIVELLPEVIRFARDDALISDVGSTKRVVAQTALAAGREKVHFIGGHPMAGSERSGVSAADPFLFQNAIYILIPDEGVPQKLYADLQLLLEGIGARVVELSAEMHDRVVAAISHLPQMLATSLVEMVGRMNEEEGGLYLPLAAGGFRDLTRIASSPFAPVWEDICSTNADSIRNLIDRFTTMLGDVRARVGDESLRTDFDFANEKRASIPRDAKGFLHRLHEILVVAEDKPGVIAEIAGRLAAENLNINDIEVMKVREGQGGTIRLGFDSPEAAEQSLVVLRSLGYQARLP